MQQSQIRQEAIPLVLYDQNTRKYQINEQSAQIIKNIQGPVAVVSVAGMYRTGKSYLLNRVILNRSDGFGVGPTVNPCTKGLWVWSTPLSIPSNSHNGQPLNLLIVDSEGTGSTSDSDLTHDTTIFALSVLLSSTFVYNSVGAIDENAIEALGLVVNLTKFIQLKSGHCDDLDPQDYQQYMPQFFWVLRDFSLQLVDHNGDTLTPSQYLDRSLGEQPGFSDDVETKNRIRRLLTAFFPERDCFTLVRPVLREDQLQQMDRLNLEQLRPEFYEQAMHFRSVLMSRVKPKTVKGQPVNGNMYVNLVKAYLEAINNGGTPNIENSWTYVIREECQRALIGAVEVYEKQIKETLQRKIPMPIEELRFQHKMSKEQAIQFLLAKAVGDEKQKFVQDLKAKLKNKLVALSALNEKESLSACVNFLSREFGPIDRKLKTSEYRIWTEYERDVRLFGQFLIEHGPKVAGNERAFLEFLIRAEQEGASVFIKSLQQELDISKTIHLEFARKSEKELKEMKEELDKEKQKAQTKFVGLEKERSECINYQFIKMKVILQENKNKGLIQNLKAQLVAKEQEFLQKAEFQKNDFKKLEDEFKQRCSELENQIRQNERENLLKESETTKTIALLEQKLTHQQNLLDDYAKREREFDSSLQSSRNEYQYQMKESQQKNEQNIKVLNCQVNDLTEQNHDLQENLVQAQQLLQNLQDRSTAKESQQNYQISLLQQQLQKLSLSNQDLQKNYNIALEQIQLLQAQESLNNSQELVQLKEINKTLEDKVRELSVTFQRERAVMEQNLQFLQLELEEKRTQVNDVRKAHESALIALESQAIQSTTHQNTQKQIVELKEQHLSEIRQLEQENINQRRKLQGQIDQLQRELSELQLQVTVLSGEKEKALNELETQQIQLDEAKAQYSRQMRELESTKGRMVKDTETRLQQRVNLLQVENDELKQKINSDSSRQQEIAEQQITELRNFYELEKDMLERRINEERQKAASRYQALLDESETKHREDSQAFEDEIEQLKEEVNSYEIQVQALQQQMENELELKSKQIESLESMLNESRESSQQVKALLQQQFESQQQQSQVDLQQVEQRCSSLQNQLQARDRDVLALTQKIENTESSLNRKLVDSQEKIKNLEKERGQLNERVEELRRKYTELCDEYLDKKINYEKCIALSTQQNEFFGRKVDELEKQLESANQRYEERLKVQKQEWADELNTQILKLSEEKTQLESKFSSLKKQARESDTILQRLKQEMEKNHALSEQKLTNQFQRIRELEEENESLKKNSSLGQSSFREQLNQQRKQLQNDIDLLRGQCHQIELERNELQGNYDKDKVLWNGKIKFLEQQRDQAKEDHSDAIRKFEMTVQQLQKARQAERGENSQEITEMLNSIERKYQEQLQCQQQQSEQKICETEEKLRILQKELKSLQDQQILDAQGKLGSQLLNEKRFHELLENEKRLYNDVESLKNERDRLIEESSEAVEQERQFWKNKISEIEDRLREQEKKHSQLIFFHEKERAKWNLEKDHLQQQKCDLQDQLQRLEKKKELLLRENEKIKSQSKSVRKYGAGNQTFIGQNVNNSFMGGGVAPLKGSDKKQPLTNLQNRTAFDHFSMVNTSQDVTKSLEEELVPKENFTPTEDLVNQSVQSVGFGGFKKYYQMMNSKQVSPDKKLQL